MARPGPAPKPSALRLVEGTDRNGRAGRKLDRSKEPLPPDEDMVPPYQLSSEAQQVWDKTVADLESMLLAASSDVWLIAAYCEQVVVFQKATDLLSQTTIIVQGQRTLVINKALLIQRAASVEMLRLAQEFGLTPSARTRVEVGFNGGNTRPKPRSRKNPFAG